MKRASASPALPIAAALLAIGCSSCSDDNAASDGGPDADTDTDTDTDVDTDTVVWGDPVPCENAPQPGEICVPGGNYLMGCVPGDTECEENEKPLVVVTHSPFFMDEKEATIEEVIPWLNAIKDGEGFITYPCSLWWTDGTDSQPIWAEGWNMDGAQEDIQCPIVFDGTEFGYNEAAGEECPQGGIQAAAGGFSWLGAKMYCEWKGMRLPTEAQWEAAARGQTFREFPCGSDLPECWYGIYDCCTEGSDCYFAYGEMCQCCAPFESSLADTCPSPLGLLNMYGNAMEWTADYVDEGHQECEGGCVDPQPPAEPPSPDAAHLAKGGNMYCNRQGLLRISARSADSIYANDGGNWTGVRCVRPDEPFIVPDAGTDSGK